MSTAQVPPPLPGDHARTSFWRGHGSEQLCGQCMAIIGIPKFHRVGTLGGSKCHNDETFGAGLFLKFNKVWTKREGTDLEIHVVF